MDSDVGMGDLIWKFGWMYVNLLNKVGNHYGSMVRFRIFFERKTKQAKNKCFILVDQSLDVLVVLCKYKKNTC